MKSTLLLIAFLVSCFSPPADIALDAHRPPEVVELTLPGQLSNDGQYRFVDWSHPVETIFQTLCADSDAPMTSVSLLAYDRATIILAVQPDGCIEPRDSAFADIVLFADIHYRLRVSTDRRVDFTLVLVAN